LRVKSPVFQAEAGVFFGPFSPAAGSGPDRGRGRRVVHYDFRAAEWAEEGFMKRSIFTTIFSILSISIPLGLVAQEKEVTLDEVVVTATRDTEEIRKIPANVTVINRREIEQSNSQTVVDLLRSEADVVVRDFYGNGKTASVDIRGFGETGPLNTLVLVDGRRVNEIDLSGVDWTQISLDQVDRIEIVRGSGSVLYGDNATGGMINIITKRPEKPISIRTEGVAGSYGYYKGGTSVGGKWGPLSAIVSASYQDTDGYRDNGFLKAKNVGGKIIYDLNENISFNLSGSFHQDDSGLPGGLPKALYAVDRRATRAPDDQAKTDDGYLALGTKAAFGDFGRFEMNLSYRTREVTDLFRSYFFEDKRNLNTWGVSPRYILERPLWIFPNKLTVGLDYYDSNSTVFSESTFFGSNKVEVTKRSTGLYFLDEISLLKNLIASLGYREEWVTYDLSQDVPRTKDKKKDREPAWNIGLDYLFDKKSSAFLSVKRSFRFPVSDELIQFYPIFQVNPGMKPQRGYHYEAGVRHAFTDQIEANLTLFWIDLKDEIFFNPVSFTNENFPKTRRQGVEVGAKVRPFEWLSLWGNYSYIKPTLREEPFSGNDIPGVARHKGSIGADLQVWNRFAINAKANVIGSRYLISDWANRVERLDGYYSIDTKVSYSWKGLKAFVGVNNLTNQKYAEWAVTNAAGTNQLFYASPERNFIGGVSFTF
jgi:iron complex outermembrane receptor protein